MTKSLTINTSCLQWTPFAVNTILSVCLVVLLFFSLTIGAVKLELSQILSVLLNEIGVENEDFSATQKVVLMNIRLPRSVFTVLIGAALGVTGAALQGLFRNPLVEPGIIGVSSGAALGAFAVILGLTGFLGDVAKDYHKWLMPPFAIIGGLMATVLTLQLGNYQGKVRVTVLILAGVAISTMASAMIGLGVFIADDQQLRSFTFWTLGDLSAATWSKIGLITGPILLSMAVLIGLARPLNALALGEAEAFHSGVNVERVKRIIVVVSAICVGVAVSFSGMIGFVGLVIPHIVRMLFSSDHRIVLPASALGGAVLLMVADIFARTVASPSELPIGVVTASLGTPFFIYLLIMAKRKNLI